MDRGNVLSGAAFKATVYVLFISLSVLAASGTAAYYFVQNTMLTELASQIIEEEILLTEIYNKGGTAALTHTISDLENPVLLSTHLVGLFSDNSLKLAGNVTVAPDFIGWSQVRVESTEEGSGASHFYFKATNFDNLTLVIGRNLDLVMVTKMTLIRAFLGTAFGVATLVLGIGYLLSRQSFRKLETLETTLDRVSQGDTKARVPVSNSNDQIDRISRRVNAHLLRLDHLMLSTRTAVASIAHDLKTPLSRAFLSLQDTVNQLDLHADPRDALERTEAELLRVNAIFDTILRIARIEADASQSNFKTFDLVPMLYDLVETFAPIAEDRGQHLATLPTQNASCTVVGDERMIRQMVVNLIQNAITHCPPETTITMSARLSPDGTVLDVTDTGPGIPETARLDVFDPFYRLDRSRTSTGSGLGLALVKAVAERHAATVILADMNPGLRVSISFPNSGLSASV